MKTYHVIRATLLIEQREQGDQQIAHREMEIALEALCAGMTASGRRKAICKAATLEPIRILEQEPGPADKESPNEQ
jgi:hypothetical protein